LIVLGIIAILVSIAISAYLGQREKARYWAIMGEAKDAVPEIQVYLDAFLEGLPFIVIDPVANKEVCVEAVTARNNRTCRAIYNESATYTYNNITDVIDFIINHHQAKNERSPYESGNYLFTSNGPAKGVIFITNIGNRTIRVRAYAADANTPIFDTNVSGR
jgi:type II secretory pathway pseudopilin PulG